jgi:hypothetical protein
MYKTLHKGKKVSSRAASEKSYSKRASQTNKNSLIKLAIQGELVLHGQQAHLAFLANLVMVFNIAS